MTKNNIQEVFGTFLYYARAVDCTIIASLGTIATQKANPISNTLKKVTQFLDYAASQDDNIINYKASGMVLAVHSDDSYLSETKARSHSGGHFYIKKSESPLNNDAVITLSKIIKSVMSSSEEAKL